MPGTELLDLPERLATVAGEMRVLARDVERWMPVVVRDDREVGRRMVKLGAALTLLSEVVGELRGELVRSSGAGLHG